MEPRHTPRTHYIHRLSYSAQERIVGAFLLAAMAILVWLLFTASTSQLSFEDYFTLYGEIESGQGVNDNTEVIISGLTAGKVESVQVNENNRVVVTLRMLERYHGLVRSDSEARIEAFNFGVINKSVIELTAGNPELPLVPDQSQIKIQSSLTIKQLMAKVTPALDNLLQTIEQANQLLAAIDPAVVKDSINNLNAVSRQVLAITTEIETGQGLANKIIYDDALTKKMLAITNNLDTVSEQVGQLLSLLNKELESAPGLLSKVEPLIQEVDKTIKAAQRIWPLSSAISEDNKNQQLTPQVPAND